VLHVCALANPRATLSNLAQRDRLFATTVESCWSRLTAEQEFEFRALRKQLKFLWDKRLCHLLPDDEPYGTFQNAFLSDIRIDTVAGTWACAVDLCVGDPDVADPAVRDRRRAGLLQLNGLRVWNVPDASEAPDHRLRLTDDGLLEQCPIVVDRALADAARGARVAWFLFLADLNAFAYVTADSAQFTWR
jgi:hypothetical protein